MNDLILADRELEVGFIGKLDALFEGIERMDAGHKASPSNEQFLTDKSSNFVTNFKISSFIIIPYDGDKIRTFIDFVYIFIKE